VSGGWSVRRRTSSLEMRARQGIRSMPAFPLAQWVNATRLRFHSHSR